LPVIAIIVTPEGVKEVLVPSAEGGRTAAVEFYLAAIPAVEAFGHAVRRLCRKGEPAAADRMPDEHGFNKVDRP
jgi:hypothetical protein